jgi:hypothetical protein
VAETYLTNPEWTVRGLCRDPSTPSARFISSLGIEVVKGDFDDSASILSAVQGANFIFASTDFWTIYRDPRSRSKVPLNQTLNEYAYETEIQQGKNIAHAVATLVDNGLEIFVLSVLADVKGISRSKYTWVYHYDSRAVIEEYIKMKLPRLETKTSYYVPGGFTENFSSVWKPVKDAEGIHVLSLPGVGRTKVPIIDVADTGRAVKAMHECGPGKKILFYGDMLTVREALEMWGRTNGLTTRYDQLTLQEYEKLFPPGLGRELGEMMLYIDEYGYVGDGEGFTDWKDVSYLNPHWCRIRH